MGYLIPTSVTLGKVIKVILIDKGMTQETLSTQTGVPRNSLSRKLNWGTFSYSELGRIAQALSVPLSTIILKAEQAALAETKGGSE